MFEGVARLPDRAAGGTAFFMRPRRFCALLCREAPFEQSADRFRTRVIAFAIMINKNYEKQILINKKNADGGEAAQASILSINSCGRRAPTKGPCGGG